MGRDPPLPDAYVRQLEPSLERLWGEAQVYSGKPDEAKKQFARAASLDLALDEKLELARVGVLHP
jgi:hypothetical protein